MIAVIADDFTGAAELGGVGLRYGVSVEIVTEIPKRTNVDLLVISTDSRTLPGNEAYEKVFKISKELFNNGIEWIYKKTDSVMRGHIFPELKAVYNASCLKKLICIPANPTLGRTISEGTYFIKGKYLHETGFSEIPGFDFTSSYVLDLLRPDNSMKSCVVKSNDEIPEESICIGEASSFNDLGNWAKVVTDDIIPAGAADFFTALLEEKGYKIKIDSIEQNIELGKKALFVFGSAYIKSRNFINEAIKHGCSVCAIPIELFNNHSKPEKYLDQWSDEVINEFKHNSRVIVAINQPIIRLDSFSSQLREYTAVIVKKVLKEVNINELFIEGGATVSSVIGKLKIKKFLPENELAHGVVRMKVEGKPDFYLTIKPGSYKWPEKVLSFM